MTVEQTGFKGLMLLKPRVLGDARGFFMESYSKKVLAAADIDIDFVQDNHSSSRKGVLRGLHYQNPPHPQTKLVRVIAGTILDIVIDLRRDQPTFGKLFTDVLSAENKHQLLVPHGFAHGFAVLSDVAEVIYKCDDYYYPETEGGVHILDPEIGLGKLLPKMEYVLSDKDQRLPKLADAKFSF
jgi:dTDP-4-dehydrorhamnose 3,5-epimerase